jgi:hypothetical protein
MKLKLGFLMLALTLMINGCSNDNEKLSNEDAANAFFMKLESLSLSNNDNFPEWLSIKIAEIETIHSKDISIVKVRIFQGEWNKRTVYFIQDNLNSCYLCEVYYENGENVVLNSNLVEDFCTTSKNWELIFEYGGKDDVPYKPCPCEGKENINLKIPENALLFKDSTYNNKDSIAYYAIYNAGSSSGRIIVNICNFPDYAKKWDIPMQGCEIYLKGNLYSPCYEIPNYGEELCFDIVLTNLKLK